MHVSSTAKRYGRCLARVAIDKGEHAAIGAQLDGLCEYFEGAPAVRLLLESPASSKERVLELVDKMAGAVDFSPYVANLLRVLAEERRFALFQEIAEAYRNEIDQHEGVVEVEVTTAHDLDAKQKKALEGALGKSVVAGKEVRLDLKVDPALLGGAITKVGSVVHDGSLVHQLERIRTQLIAE